MLSSCMFCSARDRNYLIFEQNRENYIGEDDLNTRFGEKYILELHTSFK